MNSGSLIAARLSINPLTVIVIVLILLVAIIAVWFLNKIIENTRSSIFYAEKNKDRKTSRKDIHKFISSLNLTKDEASLFSDIFTSHPLPNVHYILKETDILEAYLKEKYNQIENSTNESLKDSLFTLRTKLLQSLDSKTVLKTSKVLPVQTLLKYTPVKGIHHTFIIVNTNPDEMWLEIPDSMVKEDMPAILSKIKLNFDYGNSIPYELDTRVIRYQKDKNNRNIIICTQTDNINPLPRRKTQRLELNSACQFSSVKTETVMEGKQKKTTFTPSEKLHDGLLADISAGGCRIFTSLPIKPEQYLLVKGSIVDETQNSMLGLILRTTKNRNNEYILHIKLVKIDHALKNRINAKACGYSD